MDTVVNGNHIVMADVIVIALCWQMLFPCIMLADVMPWICSRCYSYIKMLCSNSQFGIQTFKGSYVSSHRAIVSEVSIGIQHITGKTVTFRNLKQINVEEFESTLDLGNIKNMRDLEVVNRIYEEELSRVLNHLAPEKTKFITMKEKRSWFDEDMAILRRVLRKSEKIWMRIRSEDSWSAYKN